MAKVTSDAASIIGPALDDLEIEVVADGSFNPEELMAPVYFQAESTMGRIRKALDAELTLSELLRSPDMRLEPVSPRRALAVLREATSKPPCPVEIDHRQDVPDNAGLLRARMALLEAADGASALAPPAAERSSPGRRTPSAEAAKTAAPKVRRPNVLQLKVTLRGSKPPIWRRLEVPADITLDRLHPVLLTAFDWHGGHLHVFEARGDSYGVPDPELSVRSERGVRLTRLAPVGASLRYTYDFGDDWDHVIAVERRVPAEEGATYPRCIGGRRAAPPDDCGGLWGYETLLEAIADPAHEEHEHYVEWASGVWGLTPDDVVAFDPAAFDLDWINMRLVSQAARDASAPDDEQLELGRPE